MKCIEGLLQVKRGCGSFSDNLGKPVSVTQTAYASTSLTAYAAIDHSK